MSKLKEISSACAAQAGVDELRIEDHYSGDVLDSSKLMEKVTSAEAATLKKMWQELAARKSLEELFLRDFGNEEKYPYAAQALEKVCEGMGYDEIEGLCKIACDKVCELCMSRGLSRPLVTNSKDVTETRAQAVLKSKATVASLGGTLPPKLALLADAAIGK